MICIGYDFVLCQENRISLGYTYPQSTGMVNYWNWSFGTGAISNAQNPTYTYADSGHYVVQLIVSNYHGCIDSTEHTIVIDPITTTYIPSAFTPGANGLNDVFMIKGIDVLQKEFDLIIFDRWGEKIFETKDLNVGWNGKWNNTGDFLEGGVYVYTVRHSLSYVLQVRDKRRWIGPSSLFLSR